MTVSVNVMNEGEANGTYLLSLMVDGKVIADKNVTLKGEATQPVNFTVRQDQPGIRNIEIDGLKDSVRVINYLRPTSGTYLFGEPDEGKIRTWYTILEVKNDWDSDVVAIITGTALPITPVTAFYVRAHSPGYGLFPRNNEYYLYLTQGKNWDNYTKEFATDKEYMRLPEKLTTWQYTFKLTLSGNITSKREGAQDVRLGSCKEEDFPRIK